MDSNFPESINQGKITKKDNNPFRISSASLQLFNKFGSRSMRLNGKELNKPTHSSTAFKNQTILSTVEILKIATARFIQESPGDVYDLIHPYQFDLSADVTKDVDLIILLLVSAEKVANHQFDRARRLLDACDHTASNMGNPVQRLVHYFSEALHTRIDRETGRIDKGECKKSEFEERVSRLQTATLAYNQKLPLFVITEYAGTQAVLDSVGSAKRIHLVDFRIGYGSHVTILMKALVDRKDCPIEMFKVTGVETSMQSYKILEDIGKRLLSFAETLSLPFSFKAIIIPDTNVINEKLFELETGEAIAVYSSLVFKNSLPHFTRLESIIQVIKKLRPVVMVLTEIEANTCSDNFMDCFVNTLMFHGANFDSFEACMDPDDPNRIILEAEYFFKAIQDVISFSDNERRMGYMKSDGWRAFFSRFGVVEMELSMSSLYQADLVGKRFACGSSCSLDTDEKCLLVGWKGTPIFSLSAWKFNYEEEEG